MPEDRRMEMQAWINEVLGRVDFEVGLDPCVRASGLEVVSLEKLEALRREAEEAHRWANDPLQIKDRILDPIDEYCRDQVSRALSELAYRIYP